MKLKSFVLIAVLAFVSQAAFSQGLSYRLSARTDAGLLDTLVEADTSIYTFPTSLKTIGTLSFEYVVVDTTAGFGVTGTYLIQKRANSSANWAPHSNGNLPTTKVSPAKGSSAGTLWVSVQNTDGYQYRFVAINSGSGKNHSNRVFAYWLPVRIPLSND